MKLLKIWNKDIITIIIKTVCEYKDNLFLISGMIPLILMIPH